jgi:hypothetical protein
MEKFGISENGFLPASCEERLPADLAVYQPLLDKLSEKTSHIGEFRVLVLRCGPPPDFGAFLDLTRAQVQLLYSGLTMVMNRYVFGSGRKNATQWRIVPPTLAAGIIFASERLGIEKAVTHASLDLFNWRKTAPGPMTLQNVSPIRLFTGCVLQG